jgi:type III pantothenate kinase
MILLDCGNSQIKAQYFETGCLRASFACAYKADWSSRLASWLQAHPCTRAYLCSVLDNIRQAELDTCLADHIGSGVTRFRSQVKALGVTNGYSDPARLGADRWMALLAAAMMVETDCIVIDAGSAITVDLLRADGQHLGGAILPGFNTSIETFKRIFSHIDFDDVAIAESDLPGCSTETAIRIDYELTSIETLPALVSRWMQIFDNGTDLLLAGGDAARVQSLLVPTARLVPDLVFRGMHRLVEG